MMRSPDVIPACVHASSGIFDGEGTMNIELSARRLTVALFTLLMIGGLCGHASAQTAVSSCQTLSASGNYFLTSNLSTTGSCLVIAAPNVAIDLKGHTITGGGGSKTNGIADDGGDRDYAIIANGKIQHFDTGINLSTSGSAIISNINASNNGSEGIFIKECCNTLNSVTADNNVVGIKIESDDSSLTKIQATGNSNGGVLITECCNTLVGSTVSNNTGIGVEMESGGDSFVVASKVEKNSGIGIELASGDNGVIGSIASNNGGDGMELTSSDNLVVASKSTGNGGAGVDVTGKFGIFSGVTVSKNASDGVDMLCRGSTASLKSQKNSGTNLVQVGPPTGDGPCANVNLNAP